jgi:hypothetical protein
MTRGPTGFWRLIKNSKYSNLTLEDVARSSYDVHRRKLIKRKGQRPDLDPMASESILNGTGDRNAVINGVFTVPICENPDGKAISSVLDPDGQNYPCMCGQPWTADKGYSYSEDQTPRFLGLSGLMFSNDWEHWCDNHNDCDEESDIDLNPILEKYRDPKTDPEIPKRFKYPYRKCRDHKDAQKHPGWPDRDQDPEYDTDTQAMLDRMRTNSSGQGIRFEA